jgi:uncharacterized membrane protein
MVSLFSPLRITLIAAFALVVAAGYLLVPAGTVIPIHWAADGSADGFLPKELALLVPAAIATLVWGVFLVVARTASIEDFEAARSVIGVTLTALTGIFLAIEIMLVLIGVGLPINAVQAIAICMGLLLLVLGNAMPKSRPNSFAGIRMPTTLRSAANWQATHRLGGVLAILGGLALLVAAVAVPANQLVWWLIACVIGPMLIASVYSIVHAARAH